MKKVFIFVAAITAVLASCSQEDSLQSSDTQALGVSSASMSANVTTKADDQVLSSGSIGVYRTLDADKAYVAQLSEYTYAASNWTSTEPIYLNNNDAKICAFYPYSYVTPADFDPTLVTLIAQKHDDAKDLVYAANAQYNNINRTAAFTMAHAYSKISFTLNKDVTYTGVCAILSLSLSNAGLIQSNTINITNGVYGTGTTGTITYNPAISSMETGTPQSTALLLPPTVTDMSDNVILTVVVDGSSLAVNIPASSFSNKFTAGNNYQVALTIKGSSISINSVKITDWNDTTVEGIWYPGI